MRSHLNILAGLLVIGVPMLALAAPLTPGPARFDVNQDGSITADEVRQTREAWFAVADADKDGVLTPAEEAALPAPGRGGNMTVMRMTRLDGDGNGVVTKAEYMGHQPLMLTRWDANGDGVITRGELQALPRGGGMGVRGGGRGGWCRNAL